jgi:hypothetical protein
MELSVAEEKKMMTRQLLASGGLLVHLDPRGDDVVVPFRFKHLGGLCLPIGLRADVCTHDMRIDDEGISGTFYFRRMAWDCRIPWPAVYAVAGANGEGSVWGTGFPEASRPGDELEQELGLVADGMTQYLVINGQAIVGEGSSILDVGGEQVPGVRWIDFSTRSARLGGDMTQIKQHFSRALPAPGTNGGPPFVMFLGYTAGRQDCRSQWEDCSVRATSENFIEIRARVGNHERVGFGAGPTAYIREWIARLAKFFRLK